MFVDPYGFKIPCQLLREIMSNQGSELLVTVMWWELDMAIMHRTRSEALTKTLNDVFGCEDWRDISSLENADERAEVAVNLMRKQINSKWGTYIRMVDCGRTRYLLLHLTNHNEGRDLIKNVLWKCSPEGGWEARKTDDPNQYLLFRPEPDLSSLENWLVEKLKKKSYTWIELEELIREEMWLSKHLWDIIKRLKDEKKIEPYNFEGKFSQKSNPTFKLVST
jgi:hypothetical protein